MSDQDLFRGVLCPASFVMLRSRSYFSDRPPSYVSGCSDVAFSNYAFEANSQLPPPVCADNLYFNGVIAPDEN